MRLTRLRHQIRNMTALERQMDRILAEQASEWVDIMKRPSLLDRIVFARWLKKHERHAAEYMAMEGLDRLLADIDPQRREDVTALISQPDVSVATLSGGPGVDARSRKEWVMHRRAALAAAAAIISALIGWGLWAYGSRGEDVHTRTGEQRVLELEDGSTVFVNTQSQVRVQFTRHAREIQLLAGEALFKVEPDPNRPFRVRAGEATIRAIGTQFNVHRSAQGTDVAVIEGKVEIVQQSPARPAARTALLAGEEAHVAPQGEMTKASHANLERTVAWRQRRLVFRLEPLASIAAEFNRYNRTPQIRVEGEATQQRRLSGVFDADDPQALASTLKGDESLEVSRTDREIVIRGP